MEMVNLTIGLVIITLALFFASLYFFYRHFKLQNKNHPEQEKKNESDPVKISHQKVKSGVPPKAQEGLIRVFHRRSQEFIKDHFDEFLEARSPAFFQNLETQKITLMLFPKNDEDPAIEELYAFWEMGFRHPELPLIFAIYFASREHGSLKSMLLGMLNYKEINISQKSLIWLYFQDVLNLSKKVNIDMFSIEDLEKKYQTDNLLFSQIISSYQGLWDRRVFMMQIGLSGMFDRLKNNPQMKDLLKIFLSRGAPFFTRFIYLRFANSLGETTENYIANIAFRFGNYRKLLKIDQPSQALRQWRHSIFQNEPQQEYLELTQGKQNKTETVLLYLSKKEHARLHIFYYLKSINAPLDEIKRNGLSNTEIDQIITKPGELPIRIRWIFFQYLVHIREWKKALDFYHALGFYKSGAAGKLFRLRCLFNHTDQKTKYLDQIKELWREYPKNLTIMNEYAVDCFEMGKEWEAQKVFRKMQKQSPAHPVISYNQATLFKNIHSRTIRNSYN